MLLGVALLRLCGHAGFDISSIAHPHWNASNLTMGCDSMMPFAAPSGVFYRNYIYL